MPDNITVQQVSNVTNVTIEPLTQEVINITPVYMLSEGGATQAETISMMTDLTILYNISKL